MGIMRGKKTPTNIPDGFYYVPIFDSLKALLKHPAVFNQVLIQGRLTRKGRSGGITPGK